MRAGRWIFWNFQQSHHRSSNLTVNFPGGSTSLEFTISSTMNLVVFQSNSTTLWVFDFESASCRTFVTYSMLVEEIGKFLVFFRTTLIAYAKFVVKWPHLLPWSYARKHPLLFGNLVNPCCCFWIVFPCYVVVIVGSWLNHCVCYKLNFKKITY